MPVLSIDDAADARFADYRNIPDPELARRRGIFVAEGRLVVRRLLESAWTTRSVMVTPTAIGAVADLLERQPSLPVFQVPQHVMDTVVGFNIHRGCLAIGERPPAISYDRLSTGATRLVALEQVGNADNVGAVFRSAAGLGADGVLLGPWCTDPLYRKAIRTSMGAALQVPFASAEPWPDALCRLRDDGWAAIGLTPSPDAPVLGGVAAAVRDRRVAIVAGHEGDGLTSAALQACTHLARIPMAGGVDSLNVAMAVTIALYALARDPFTAAV